MKRPNCQPRIVITHDESILSANDGIKNAWTRKSDSFLQSKEKK